MISSYVPTLPCFIYCWPRLGLSKLLLKSLCGAVWLGILGALLLWDRRPAFAEALVLKQGELRDLPLLQTRARLPLQPLEMLYLGMFEERFLNYARANNWETISSNREDPRWTRWQLRPGGEALYLADLFLLQDPLQPPIYARGFYVQAYFVGGRLVGMHLIQNPEEPGFNLKELQKLIRAWFPDNRLMLHYQVLPEDPHQQVLGAYLGNIPSAFIDDIQRNRLPFCQTFLTPTSPQPITPPSIDPPPHCLRMTDSAHLQAEVNGATALGEGSPLVR